jgi:hypothetical protein
VAKPALPADTPPDFHRSRSGEGIPGSRGRTGRLVTGSDDPGHTAIASALTLPEMTSTLVLMRIVIINPRSRDRVTNPGVVPAQVGEPYGRPNVEAGLLAVGGF